jgi:hypothetical protein
MLQADKRITWDLAGPGRKLADLRRALKTSVAGIGE